MTAWEVAAYLLRLTGLVCLLPGLFLAANGLRVVVSGRFDERKTSARALKIGLPLVAVGLLLLFGGSWLANWAQT
jgi:hypothetical protein